MRYNRRIDRLCILAITLAAIFAVGLLVVSGLFPAEKGQTGKEKLNLSAAYQDTLFDTSRVHTINLIVKDVNWDFMVAHAMEEQYIVADAEIDGELVTGIAIRPKGNSSLASIAKQGSDRFSFKIEFDHYTAGQMYHGLDKLALNNLGQDLSAMKDFLTYRMMAEMGVHAPLCSYVEVRKNGEPFGLYLAVEGVEDSFAFRTWGEAGANIYRPDVYAIETVTPSRFMQSTGGQNPFAEIVDIDIPSLTPGDRLDILGPVINLAFSDVAQEVRISAGGYNGEKAEDYRVVFDTAVFTPKETDKARYISAVKELNTGDTPLSALDVEQLSRYFAVHIFNNNYDSYNGIFAHNYYLCEKDGRLSLIPWDYNLGFGAFSLESAYKSFLRGSEYYTPMDAGQSMSATKSYVNYPIDTPVIGAQLSDRPMLQALLENEEGKHAYYAAIAEMNDRFFAKGRYDALVDEAAALITPYVDAGLTFYSGEEFRKAADSVRRYGHLRAESMQGQLDGAIPATLDGQKADWHALVEVGGLDMADTIDFSGLAFGITPGDVDAVIGAVFEGYDTMDAERLMADLQADPGKILPLILRVIRSTPLISGAISDAVKPGLLLVVSVVVLLLAIRCLKRQGIGWKRKAKR